ncbi:MAG: hypothetical protein KDC87_20445 [Planctomycetes bacterium]|nr:hypothetical protein [Planctomycetota bacterium]MCB9869859.1 hypothetical protein [Planctomycetota bacterium]MCB9889090.1 hypothetical protein [Planctomycetota bacterium]
MPETHHSQCASRQHESGLTFVEIVVVLAVISLLAGIIVPSMMSVTKDAHATKIISTFQALRLACEQHYAHTGSMALEYSGSSYQAATYHKLSMTQTTTGWKGPYIDHPISFGDNPFGTTIHLYNSVSALTNYAAGGFDMNGDGTDDITTDSNVLVVWGVPESTAKAVDDSLDRGNLGADWKTSGRVEWNNDILAIYIIKP